MPKSSLSFEVEKFAEILACSKSPVFFGGAGVSTESGIPDFRSQDGLYNMKYDFPPEVILSHSFFLDKTAEFYKFYKDKMLIEGAVPNATHEYLAKHNIPVITQNIDGLHSFATSGNYWNPTKDNISELHGSIHRNFCMQCHEKYGIDIIKDNFEKDGIPRCRKCQGLIKPDVVLYEEPLDANVWDSAENVIREADLLIIGGTSLTVYPAASLISYFRGRNLVLINRDVTQADVKANIVIRQPIGEVFATLKTS